MQHILQTLRNLSVLFGLLLISSPAFSQEEETTPMDSTEVDSVVKPEVKLAKQYERFRLAIDTVTNLVTYKAVVDQTETGLDSFYVRAKKWCDRKYNLQKNKKMVLFDKPNEKLILKGHFDSYTSTGKYNKVYNGTITFQMTLIFKDDKYKYIIDNIYWEPEKPATKDEEKLQAKEDEKDLPVPLEYYLNAKTRVKVHDNRLRCADTEFQSLITDMKKTLQNPIQIDEEDF